eukprot:GHVR01034711.1.p1 GENE.GHVR01034711.1~~GHVR01034711.1.p1  ORF type:complete len:110 (-),score=11.63 GHVR01034711.1:67-396(-)
MKWLLWLYGLVFGEKLRVHPVQVTPTNAFQRGYLTAGTKNASEHEVDKIINSEVPTTQESIINPYAQTSLHAGPSCINNILLLIIIILIIILIIIIILSIYIISRISFF